MNEVLQRQAVIEPELADKLKKMVVFRNLVINRYQQIDLEIVKVVILSGLDDLITFGDRVLTFTRKTS